MPTSQVPRLKDVAKEAKVSIAAASRILRGDKEPFGEDTCRRVLEASRNLGWRRNLLVNGMQTGRTQTIGVMIPPNDSYWVAVLSGIHETLAERDFLPITVWTGSVSDMPHFEKDEVEGLKQINRLLDRRVDGLIMWPAFSLAYYHHFPEFVERRVPVAVIDQYSAVADSVETDEEQATSDVARHLVDLGHRRIACISSRESASHTWSVMRRTSFENAVRNCPGATVKSWHLNAQASDGVEVSRRLLTNDFRPTAVFAVTDHVAACVYHAAAELEMSVPKDLSIVGFADLDFAATMKPPLTTMRQKPQEVGRLAAKLILDRVDGVTADNDAPTIINVTAELVIRNSTAKPPRNHRLTIHQKNVPENVEVVVSDDDLDRRIVHIREAAQHLQAAGLQEVSDELKERSSLMAQLAEANRRPPSDRESTSPSARTIEDLSATLCKLRAQIKSLEDQISELRSGDKRP